MSALPTRERVLARRAGLRYVNDSQPGFHRRRRGAGFSYITESGRHVKAHAELMRIRELGIPPAWTNVWICRFENGHLQSTGRDARERKQYLYHERWRLVADDDKFSHLVDFGEALPRIRARVDRDLRNPEWNPRKLTAFAGLLLDRLALRIGNEEYTRDNESYGLSTLLNRHVQISGHTATFDFPGKSGQQRHCELTDRRIANLLQELKQQKTRLLLCYRQGRRRIRVTPAMVNDYLREISGKPLTAKDFRTWRGCLVAANSLACALTGDCPKRKSIRQAIQAASDALGNTFTICKKHYVHAALSDLQQAEVIDTLLKEFRPQSVRQFRADEQRLLSVLRVLTES